MDQIKRRIPRREGETKKQITIHPKTDWKDLRREVRQTPGDSAVFSQKYFLSKGGITGVIE